MSLRVRTAGLYSLVVDRGRERMRHLGVPLGGAADRAALALGNALVGNPPDAAAIELTLSGPTLEALHPTACVIFGAPFHAAVNEQPIASGTTLTLEPGDVLRIDGTAEGVRGYFCVAGGFEPAPILGSRSELAPLRAGDVAPCRASRILARSLPFISLPAPPAAEGNTLRVLDGPQRDWFLDLAFLTHEYAVAPASNRMGLRLRGVPLPRRAGELVSEAVAPGAVQITNDGLPIVLGVDGQTIGGYPKIAHVIRADLDRLAQLRPGARVRFLRVSADEADEAARKQTAVVAEWTARLRFADRQPELY